MVATAQRLVAQELPMVEFPQTTGNLTEASSNLFELIKGGNLVVYPDAELRLAVQRSVAIETSRGWRIAKDKATHKIDVVVALAQAALGAVEDASQPAPMIIPPEARELARIPRRHGRGWGRPPLNAIIGTPYPVDWSTLR
jgi:phage terminase large subunit-like protein